MIEEKLPVVEEFYSLQGEGYYMGTAAYFVRLAGCDVGCHWCDSKPSWKVHSEQWTNVEEIIKRIMQNPSNVVVITGGEPFVYNLSYLTSVLRNNGIRTHIETCGTEKITGVWDWISFSPKTWSPPLNDFYSIANELKVVIQNNSDFVWAEECKLKVNSNCKLFLQPEWTSFNKILPIVVEYIKLHPEWRISIQTHKFMKIQ